MTNEESVPCIYDRLIDLAEKLIEKYPEILEGKDA